MEILGKTFAEFCGYDENAEINFLGRNFFRVAF